MTLTFDLKMKVNTPVMFALKTFTL